MKLVFSDMDGLEYTLRSIPTMNCSGDASITHSVSFEVEGTLGNPEDVDPTDYLHGHIVWKDAGSNYVLREFDVESFNHYEVSEVRPNVDEEGEPIDDGIYTRIYFTDQEPTPPPPEPEPIPEPEPPSEEELLAAAKSRKISEVNNIVDECVTMGIVLDTEFGEERFRLTEKDKTMLLSVYSMVQAGLTSYPYHSMSTTETGNICVVYSDEDIGKIAMAAFAFITFHESYSNMLMQWINRETDRMVVEGIHYGSELPADLQQYLMMIMMSAAGDMVTTIMPKNMPMSGSQIELPPYYASQYAPLPEEEEPAEDEDEGESEDEEPAAE